MTDRKPAIEVYRFLPGSFTERPWILASDLPPAILALTAPELRALAVFAEAMPELLWRYREGQPFAHHLLQIALYDAALAAEQASEAGAVSNANKEEA